MLLGLSFLPPLLAHVFRAPDPIGQTLEPRPPDRDRWVREGVPMLLVMTAVSLVVAWEAARWIDRTIRAAPIEVLGFLVALPVAVPLALVAGGLAQRATLKAGDHPLFQQLVPASIGVGAVVYLLVTALIVLAVKERRRELTSGDPPQEPPQTPAS